MEAGITPTGATGSRTIADLCARAVEQHADRVAVRHKVDGSWQDVTCAQLYDAVCEIGLGLIAAGLQPGERVAILADTRPEWTYVDFAITMAGGVVVPTNSPQECAWVAGDSGAAYVVCEDAEQVAKIGGVRGRLPALRTVIVMDPAGDVGDALSLGDLRGRGERRERRLLEERAAAVAPDDPFTFIYTSGTTGPPKGCVLSHRNYRSVLDMTAERGLFEGDENIVYLFLPLAHAFALLIQLEAIARGPQGQRRDRARRAAGSPTTASSAQGPEHLHRLPPRHRRLVARGRRRLAAHR